MFHFLLIALSCLVAFALIGSTPRRTLFDYKVCFLILIALSFTPALYFYLRPAFNIDYQTAWVKLASDAFAKQQYNVADYAYAKAIELGEPKSRIIVGSILSHNAKLGINIIDDRQEKQLEKAIELSPDDVYPRLLLANYIFEKRGSAAACQYLKQFKSHAKLVKSQAFLLENAIERYKRDRKKGK